MPSIIVPRDAGNWVDRGEPDLPKLMTVINHFFGPERGISEERLEAAAHDIRGLVWADATELHVSGYLRRLGEELGIDESEVGPRRMAATALWSIAKLAMIRDTALLEGERRVPPQAPSQPLSEWLASRLLSPEELEDWQRERDSSRGAQSE
jgi:hypothetical protein